MKILRKILPFCFLLTSIFIYGQDIFRFEHYDSKDGLSQNTVNSLLCDKDGFLWVGTVNGLNRFDGYRFKSFNSLSKNNSFINNRVINLWQDKMAYIWIETYDHYYHFFNPVTETFQTVPDYYDPNYDKINQATCFLQYNPHQIWIGTNERGIYFLEHDDSNQTYNSVQLSDKGRYAITNNDVRFIFASKDSALWVGTARGVNMLNKADLQRKHYNFHHYFIEYSFNSAIELDDEIWLATDKQGLVCYNKQNHSYNFIKQSNNPLFPSDEILNIYNTAKQTVLVAFKDGGLMHYSPSSKQWQRVNIHGDNVDNIYFDHFDNAWVTTETFGVTKLNLNSLSTNYYQLTEPEQISITDRERHVFYEDKDTNLWIGLHGGALAYYNRLSDSFYKYINNPSDNYSISSNIVHCITEDLSGQMWIGTGQYKGGLEKVVMRNAAFKHLLPSPNVNQITDNVVRCAYQDKYERIWLSTKNGRIHVYNKDLKKLQSFQTPSSGRSSLRTTNVYSLFIDEQNYIWLGTKGHGLFISQTPISENNKDLNSLQFHNYTSQADDSTSLPNNNIYSIERDKTGNIWVGTYGNGICKVHKSNTGQLTFKRYNTTNSNLSSDQVRKIKCDSDSNLWIATAFGVNLLHKDSLAKAHITFQCFYKETGHPQKINYNDVGEIYEDSNKRLWFGTLGGGVSSIELPISAQSTFTNLTTEDGLSNNVVYGILEDSENQLWFSSEYGLNRFNTATRSFEIYNESNGLSFNNFSESTCFFLQDGRLVFGGSEGAEVINTQLIKKTNNKNLIELTNFQLFNKDVVVNELGSPLDSSISFSNNINLKHHQSSFSIEYSALDYLDPSKVQYAYQLYGFESNWNYVGNQTKATYTNLPHGRYTFKVKHTNRSGQWNNDIRTLSITIAPPWWKTIWSYMAYTLLILAVFWLARIILLRINKYRSQLTLEKRINELKLRFFTNISHEIRTPLTLILGPLEDILHEGKVNDDIKNQLKLMKKNTKRMLALVNQLLDFRKIQNNKMNLNVQEINLVTFTQNIYESFIPLAKHNGVQLKFKKQEDSIKTYADAVKLDSIIYNLISNAIKFTPKGKRVLITVETDSNNPEMALVNVQDEGPGIAHENIPDIFTRFVILNKNDNRGSGIGLALAFELAKLHNGDLKVNSQVDKGSCFCFSIPVNNHALLQSPSVSSKETPTEVNSHRADFDEDINTSSAEPQLLDKSKTTVLIVEDNHQIANYIQSQLKTDFNCIVAENGHEGLKQAAVHNPDAIVTDIMMPEMDGIEMTQLLKDNFSLCHIPVVMMTAKTDEQDKIKGFETGAEAYITKPLNVRHLKAVLSSFINQRKLIISKYRDNKTIDPDTLKVNTKDEEFLHQLLTYIETNYSADLSIETVAKEFCVSRTVLYNKVKGLTGLSPLEFIRQVKLKLSLELLKKGYSVSETAYKVGYTDVKYFSRQFKMVHGYPPSQVKTNLKK
ncbi:response regulator [Carboxylicivirga sp. A043]|uniref:hybrid sensor histidine kinase/response regulator transcription factor n=1 Tax=Carboxylicivirga litoralis TaxID=2816963 RepID=UPI0021CAF8DB|nr:hybrid sensor histidine kinase/response regulator transcription factor [Carboxylicivirga sp. A043]MCU4158027.1 response regulator [Carboxylicivirga sp. A043]